jgi:hypothetical protein
LVIEFILIFQVPCIYGGTTEVQIPEGTQPMGEFVLVGQVWESKREEEREGESKKR